MGNKGICSCCENNPTPRDSQFKINLVLNSEAISCSCLPSEIDHSNSKAHSQLESFFRSGDVNKYESFQCSRASKTSHLRPSIEPQHRNISIDDIKEKIKKKRCVTPVNQCGRIKERYVPCVTINLRKPKK